MELTTQKTYSDFKRELDQELTKSAEGFVRIGYLLKIARDTEILTESGYANVNDFASAEYGLDKSQVSRFININDRFSENGYSDRLQDQYKAYGYAKLAMMLTLPDSVVTELTPAYSKSEIQMVKEEIEAEEQISPMEVYLEGENEEQQNLETLLMKVLHQLFHDDPKLYLHLHHQIKHGGEDEDIKDALAPAGDSFYSVRIQGVGRKFLTTKENVEDVTITDARTGEKEMYTWQDIICICNKWVDASTEAKVNWEQLYAEPFPMEEEKKSEVAPVQPKNEPVKEVKKPAVKKQSKVTKAKIAEKPEKLKADEPLKTVKNEPKAERNDVKVCEIEPKATENKVEAVSETEVETSEIGINTTYGANSEGQKKAYIEDAEYRIDEVKRFMDTESYDVARAHASKLVEILDKLSNIPKEDEE